MNAIIYRIAKWSETFETSESKRYKNLTWVSLPVGFSSNGYHELITEFGPDAPAIYGAWCALLSIAAQAPVRGTIASSKGPYSLSRIASETRMPVVVFERLFTWASQEKVGWLVMDTDPTATQQPPNNSRLDVALPDLTLPDLTKRDVTNCPAIAEPSASKKRFSPPSIEEVKAYCQERKNSVDPDKFHSHYSANGWVQGRGKPIKDWKAAVRTWEGNDFSPRPKQPAFKVHEP